MTIFGISFVGLYRKYPGKYLGTQVTPTRSVHRIYWWIGQESSPYSRKVCRLRKVPLCKGSGRHHRHSHKLYTETARHFPSRPRMPRRTWETPAHFPIVPLPFFSAPPCSISKSVKYIVKSFGRKLLKRKSQLISITYCFLLNLLCFRVYFRRLMEWTVWIYREFRRCRWHNSAKSIICYLMTFFFYSRIGGRPSHTWS